MNIVIWDWNNNDGSTVLYCCLEDLPCYILYVIAHSYFQGKAEADHKVLQPYVWKDTWYSDSYHFTYNKQWARLGLRGAGIYAIDFLNPGRRFVTQTNIWGHKNVQRFYGVIVKTISISAIFLLVTTEILHKSIVPFNFKPFLPLLCQYSIILTFRVHLCLIQHISSDLPKLQPISHHFGLPFSYSESPPKSNTLPYPPYSLFTLPNVMVFNL